MKKIYLTLFILLLSSPMLGNPVPPPPVISEIYFEDNNWTIELAYGVEWPEPLFLDECELISSAGEATFNEGYVLFPDSILLITEDDLSNPLFIDKNGDFIRITGSSSLVYVDDFVCFGDYSGSWVNAPYEGQSLARVIFEIYNPPESDIYFYLVKDNIPSLGYNPYQANTVGAFFGYVFDEQNNPIPNAQIHSGDYFDDIYTNQNGYFEAYMYGMNYDVTIYVDDTPMLDTLITVEPDSTTWCTFYINLNSVDKEQLQTSKITLNNYPNPFIESTTISSNIPTNYTNLNEEARIKIYNIKGQLVKQFNPPAGGLEFKINEVVWDGKDENGVQQPPGFYFYSLEGDGRKVQTNKMIMVR